MKQLLLFLVSIFTFSLSAFAGEALFGPEFNFTNQEIIAAGMKASPVTILLPENRKAQVEFADIVKTKCAACKIDVSTDKLGYENFIVHHPDGWRFFISLDPWVVEVQVDPMTAQQIAKSESEIQRLIFDTAHELSLSSQDEAGHIHIGVETAFAKNPLLFRNFLADWFVHSKMAFNLFGANMSNAPTVDAIGAGSLQNLTDLFKLFDESGLWKRAPGRFKTTSWIKDQIRRLQKKLTSETMDDVFLKTPRGYEIADLSNAILDYVYFQTASKYGPSEKYQGLNLTRMRKAEKDQTIELRSVHEMSSAAEYLTWARLLQGRINFLEKTHKPLPFTNIRPMPDLITTIDAFRDYAEESGLSWREVSPLTVAWYRARKPSARVCSEVFSREAI